MVYQHPAYRFAVLLLLSIALLALCPPVHADPTPAPKHVILITMDGLRPDMVTPELMPTLHGLSTQGVTFANHHPVYPSSTEVNGAVLATGRYPQNNGVIANREYRPDINPKEAVPTHTVKLLVPTIAEIIFKHQMSAIISGTKPVARLANPLYQRATGDTSVTVYGGLALTPDPETSKSWPAFPPKANPTKTANAQQDAWTTDRIIERINAGTLPAFAHLWLSEPDFAQHGSGILSGPAKEALKSSDTCLANLVAALKKQNLWESANLLIVSDHGFSTIIKNEDIANRIEEDAKLSTVRNFIVPAKPGDILVVGNGATVLFYVTDHDKDITQKLVNYLQTTDYAGVIFTRDSLSGTFPLTQAFLGSKDAPDVVLSLKWTHAANAQGVKGTVICDSVSGLKVGSGMHVSLSPYDMHNTLIAVGPSFKPGFVSQTPSGNLDIAPTILALLGLPDQAQKLDGRILAESLRNSTVAPPTPVTQTIEAQNKTGQWTQSLTLTNCGKSTYILQGTGQTKP
jgi:predicted AlkP superfamily pyrophosphatase or phosphodiesterase